MFSEGFLAGVISTLITHPLEFLKVRKQNSLGYSTNILRGVVINPITYGLHYSIYFTIYNSLKKDLYTSPFEAAFAAQMASSIVLSPLWIIRTRRMVHNDSYKKILNDLRSLQFVSRGVVPNTVLSLQTGASYGILEYLDKNNGIVVNSFLSKTISGILFYPLDTIRTVLRTDGTTPEKEIIQRFINKPIHLYNGLGYYLVRSVPSFMISNYIFKILTSSKPE